VSYADFFANKQIIVSSSNSSSFFQYFADDDANLSCMLNLSGVTGPFFSGSAAMYIRFFVNPIVPISNIITPADTGYDGQIIIETYGPAYSSGTSGSTCGTANFGNDVLFMSNAVPEGGYISSTRFYPNITYVNFGVATGSLFATSSIVNTTTYFNDATSVTPPAGLPLVNTLGKLRSFRSRITFEVDDWASKSYNINYVSPVSYNLNTIPPKPVFASCFSTPYNNMMRSAPGGRYAFSPGDSGWRLQSVTNYSGSIAPLFPNGVILYSPNKTAYKVIVSNSGVLSAIAI